eukprot:NODE_458_length_7216_cov_0.728537.p3 type:complete len:167 gc:universal NODE_458_length_7216_cov_0.728537:2570-2070(-)
MIYILISLLFAKLPSCGKNGKYKKCTPDYKYCSSSGECGNSDAHLATCQPKYSFGSGCVDKCGVIGKKTITCSIGKYCNNEGLCNYDTLLNGACQPDFSATGTCYDKTCGEFKAWNHNFTKTCETEKYPYCTVDRKSDTKNQGLCQANYDSKWYVCKTKYSKNGKC